LHLYLTLSGLVGQSVKLLPAITSTVIGIHDQALCSLLDMDSTENTTSSVPPSLYVDLLLQKYVYRAVAQ
jgi:hypothetical protein